MGDKLDKKELEELYEEIMTEMHDIVYKNSGMTDLSARREEIIRKIDAHPEVLRVQTNKWRNQTIGICAAYHEFFDIVMRTLRDIKASELRDDKGYDIYDEIKDSINLSGQIVNSDEYKELVKKLQDELDIAVVIDDEDEDMDQYDSIME